MRKNVLVWTSWFCRISFVFSFFDRKIIWITYSTGASFYNITADGIKDLRFLIMVVRVVDFSSMKYKIGNNFAEIYINIPKGNHWILEKKISKDWYNELSKNSFDLIKKGSEKNHYEENLLSYVSRYLHIIFVASCNLTSEFIFESNDVSLSSCNRIFCSKPLIVKL